MPIGGTQKTNKATLFVYEVGQDVRLDFLYEYVTRSLRCKVDKWSKLLSTPDQKSIVNDFLDVPEKLLINFTLSLGGALSVSETYDITIKSKSCYFIKKEPLYFGKEEVAFKDNLVYGDLSQYPIEALVTTLQCVVLPIINGILSDEKWPSAVTEDCQERAEDVGGVLQTIVGLLKGKTFLQIPPDVSQVLKDTSKIPNAASIKLKSDIESLVVKWNTHVSEVLQMDSNRLFDNGRHPTPTAELQFWEERVQDLQCIYDQLNSPRVKNAAEFLNSIDSSYYRGFATIDRNVTAYLNESKSILTFLKPLRKHLEAVQGTNFELAFGVIRRMMHTICFIWAYSPFYQQPSRIIILFKQVCNLLIEISRSYLGGSMVFQLEPEEGLSKVTTVLETLKDFKLLYDCHRCNLQLYFEKEPVKEWDFLPKMIFTRFDSFIRRINRLVQLFSTAVELYKLEKVEIGGSKGRIFSGEIIELYDQFLEYFQQFSSVIYDCTDPEDESFEMDMMVFEERVFDTDIRLSHIILQAMDDCHTPESAAKLITILGPLLKRPVIKTDFERKYEHYVNLIDEEITFVIDQFDGHVKCSRKHNSRKRYISSMPEMSALLHHVEHLKDKLNVSISQFRALQLAVEEEPAGIALFQRHKLFVEVAEDYQETIFRDWSASVNSTAKNYFNQPVLISLSGGKLVVNYIASLEVVSKDVKNVLRLNFAEKHPHWDGIPESAMVCFRNQERFRTAYAKLNKVCRWYNEIKGKVTSVEREILHQKFSRLQDCVEQGTKKLKWGDPFARLDEFIQKFHECALDLTDRISKSQENLLQIEKIISAWNNVPVFNRINSDKLLMFDLSQIDGLAKERRFKEMGEASEKILALVEENYLLLEGHLEGSGWKKYIGVVDGKIVDGLSKCVGVSLGFLLDHTDPTLTPSPLLEIKMNIDESGIFYEPTIVSEGSPEEGDTFLSQLESIIQVIFHQTNLVQKPGSAAGPPQKDSAPDAPVTYFEDVHSMSELQGMKEEVLERAQSVMNQTLRYVRKFDKFNYIFEEDQEKKLESMTKLGDTRKKDEFGLSIAEMDDDDEMEEPASLDQFQVAIDKFETMLQDIENFESETVFDGWFRINLVPFKKGLGDTVRKWCHLFKQHLIDSVTNGLAELEEFITETTKGLQQTLVDGDLVTLISVMEFLQKIKLRTASTEAMFEPIKEYIELLKRFDYELPETIFIQLENLPGAWAALKRQAQYVRLQVAPLQANEVSAIRKRIHEFDAKQIAYRDAFQKLAFFDINCPFPYQELNITEKKVSALEREYSQICSAAKLFEVPVPDPKALKQCRRELRLVKGVWDYFDILEGTLKDWKMSPWKTIDAESMDMECKRMAKEVKAMDKDVKLWPLYGSLESLVRNTISSLKSVAELQNPSIKARHWEELLKSTKILPRLISKLIPKFVENDNTTLADLYSLNLHDYEEEVKNVVDKAVKESSMEKTLRELHTTWAQMNYEYELHPRTGIRLVKPAEELIEVLEENQVQVQNIAMSKYIAFFREEVDYWQKRLHQADSVLSIIVEVQRTWCHLESIFVTTEDIRRNLPEDSARFERTDKLFKDTLEYLYKTTNVIEGTNQEPILPSLEKVQKELSLCEKALADYLETKRLSFPRFYFVSSSDLLDILSSGNEPSQVSRHLTKLFDSLAGLQFYIEDEKPTKIAHSMKAKDGEVVRLVEKCNCFGAVETWLGSLENIMRKTIRLSLKDAVQAYAGQKRDKWIKEYQAQVALAGTQIWWTTEVNHAFAEFEDGSENALKDYYRKQVNQLNTLINLLVGELTVQERQKIMTICTIDVHSRDVVGKLIQLKIETSQAFQWQGQLRHRWGGEDCIANICDAEFVYWYEYLGNTPRLVITPLTDRCYITLTQSLHLVMGGAPAGPAGTGKTETTKDLGRALGMMVYVFNCSEQMDYRSIGSIFKGLAMTGAWGCFDEFNRISVEVLSVVAVQVKSIQDAIKNQKKIFSFMGEDIRLLDTIGIFITMNPGYAGRSELPENLKVLFRPCAMVVPDFELICEIMLIAEGFQDAKVLARKFITLYTLCKELLSKQDHYDWGLRAIKSVLVVAGSLKRGDAGRPEDEVLMRALRDFNMPKIVSDDIPVFMGLIGDLFPALDVPRKRDTNLEAVIKEAIGQLRLKCEEAFILKVVQLEEILHVRHSVFIVGNAGTGKTQVWRTLFKTFQNMKLKPMYDDLNPKAVTNDELFGVINSSTREWKDGIFSTLMREQANSSGEGPKWIVLDGDIDPMWIESLNTVMDDNKVLTLASNERIPLTATMRLLFEIHTLRSATPATVSRAGILYLNPQDLGWNAYVTSWLSHRSDSTEVSTLLLLFEKYVPAVQEVVKNRFKTIVPVLEISHIQLLCNLLDALLTKENVPPDCPREWYEVYFVFACIWAYGSATYVDQMYDYRSEFSKWWLSEWKFIKFPQGYNVFDVFIDNETKNLQPWSEVVPKFELDSDVSLQAVLVHTPETVRLKFFMDLLVEKGKPIMFVGAAGTGKTVIVNDKLSSLADNYMVANVPFNYYTTSEMLQRVLEKPLEKKAGRNYGPPGSKKLVYFIDDLNMPMVDYYGTVQPHTLIRQHIDYGHWFDRTKITLKDIHNVQYIACMNPTSGSFNINPRLQRHFAVFACSFPGSESLQGIYRTILQQHVGMQIPNVGPIHKMCPAIVAAALALHQKVNHSFIPTAMKFHYIFNLRDLSNVFQGLLFSSADCLRSPVDLVRLWVHESTRVYGDKLTEEKDILMFHKFVADAVKKQFEEMDDTAINAQPLMYFHFASGAGDPKYMPVSDFNSVQKFLVESLKSYNDFNSIMNLVLFDAAVNYVCRISRILESPRGNALLVGVGGSGKQSLARLAAFMSGLDVFQITLRKGYSSADLKTDLAALYLKAGLKNLGTMFLMTDAQVAEETFLVLINDMLASGEITDLLPDDEIDNVIGSMRSEVKGIGLQDTRENCWKFFIDRVRKVLKTVLCFSPVGTTLRNRSRKFPAVTNCTSIVWFHEWPHEALISVSQRFVRDISVLPKDLHDSIANFMAFVHTSVSEMSKVYLANEKRHNYTTPKSFLEQIACYTKLVTSKTNDAIVKANRLESGLTKLESCAQQVEELKKVLAAQEVILKEKNDKADELICKVREETALVTTEKENAAREEAKVALVAEEVAKIQEVCQIELEKAEPALQAAYAALNTLNKTNLTELKTFTTPPTDVVNVVAAVFILWEGTQKGRLPKDKSWKVTKSQMMGDVGRFLEGLQNLNKEGITPMIVDALKPYITDPGFQPELIRSKSFAASGLCSYVINVLKYNEVYQDVAPKRRALQEATDDLNANLDKLQALKTTIQELEEKLAGLTTDLEVASEAKAKCQAEADKTTSTIDLANRLVNGLASEKIRWIQNVQAYRESTLTIPGDMLIVTAFVSYVGCFSKKYRSDLLDKTWVPYLKRISPTIPTSENIDPLMVLTDNAEIAKWNSNGLPSDRMSSENATILMSSQRWPLIIDPQLQGIKWIKNEYGSDLRIIRLGQKGYLDVIEEAVVNGQTVLIENIGESVDPVLEPLLGRNLIKKATAIKIGDREVDYNSNFRLILHAKLANPHYQPEMQAQTTLINFTVTRDGLEDQLLAEVVKVERPDLEMQKSRLTQQQNEYNILLQQLEDDLLSRLQSAQGNFLDDASLVINLETTKKTAEDVEVKAGEAIITSANINAARELYRPAASRASLLYFILNDLHKINPIYQFSLKAFSTVFHNAIKSAKPSSEVDKRIEFLIDSLTYSVWLYTTRGLFESDKLIFTSQLAFQIMIHKDGIQPRDMDFLLRFPSVPNQSSPIDCISNYNWGALKCLSQIDDFRGIDKEVENQSNKWKNMFESECPEREKFPGEWKTRTGVQRLCIMRCLRPDRMTQAVSAYVEETMGNKYVKATRLDFAKSFEETSKETPVFFILSPGVNPLTDVEKLGKSLGFTLDKANLHSVSLGQGQEVVAEKALETAADNGHWVILQNIHLVAKWLPKLEKKIEQLCEGAHDNYRVFLSAEPASRPENHLIPQGILESSIKITNEAPTGMLANLHKAMDNFGQDTMEMCTKELEFKAVLFSLCYFHAVVAERRKFGAQGWNRNYPFNTGDLLISVNVLYNYLEANNQVPWENLRYLFGEIMYGGHITDDWDRRLCRAYLEEYMVQDLLDGEISYAPAFPAPPSTDFHGYHKYIDEYLPAESPVLYGLHSNAEIGFLTSTAETLFKTIFELQPRDTGNSSDQAPTKDEKMRQMVDDVLDKLPEPFNMSDIQGRAEEKTPYVIVVLQECERMNCLTVFMRHSLKELDLALKGELTMTSELEDLGNAIFLDQVPPAWVVRAYPTTLGLGSWFADLVLRTKELETWSTDFLLPPSVWLAGFFNPQSFLTAIMQSTARKQELPLDKMCLQCDVTKRNREETTMGPKDGASIHGLYLEGARWDTSLGILADSKPKELFAPMPVIALKAITQDKQDIRNMYECPVYKTKIRGITYVWTFNLRTKEKPAKWILRGTAILLQI